MSKDIYIPVWARQDPKSLLTYICRLAVIYHSQSGTARAWAERAGVSPRSIDVALARGYFTAKIAIKLVNALPEPVISMNWLVEPGRFLGVEVLTHGN